MSSHSMQITRTVNEFRDALRKGNAGARPGFVPTMGALHAGHMALVDRSVGENETTVCSIFVNPRQFNSEADLARYPRHEAADCALLEKHRCQVAFLPSVDDVYPGDADPDLQFGVLVTTMEGRNRPGHFNGVAAVVYRLFKMVEPARAYFGEKDFQQLAVIRSLVEQLRLPIEITGCPTVREAGGLAMSSRNVHLTTEERRSAGTLFQSLQEAKELYRNRRPVEKIKEQVKTVIEKCPHFRLEYFEIADERTMQPLMDFETGKKARAFLAVLTSKTRLIDNLPMY